MWNEGNQINNLISSSGSGTVINYGSGTGSDFVTNYGSGSGRNVTVPTVPVPVPQRCFLYTVISISAPVCCWGGAAVRQDLRAGRTQRTLNIWQCGGELEPFVSCGFIVTFLGAIGCFLKQCCGSDPDVFGRPGSGSNSMRYGSGSFYHQAKGVRQNLDSYCFVTSL